MEEYKEEVNSRDNFNSTSILKNDNTSGFHPCVLEKIIQLDSCFKEHNLEGCLEILKFLTNKYHASNECLTFPPLKEVILSENSNSYLTSEIFSLFQGFIYESVIDCIPYALKALIMMSSEEQKKFDNLIYFPAFLEAISGLMKCEIPRLRVLSRILIANTATGNEIACLPFIEDFLIQDPQIYPSASLFWHKIFDYIPEDFNFQLLVNTVIDYINTKEEQPVIHAYNIMLKAFNRKNPIFIKNCIENKWWEDYVQNLISNSLTKLKSLGYMLMSSIVGFIPSQVICEAPLIPTQVVFDGMKAYFEGNVNGRYIMQMMNFLKLYVEVFGQYVNELFIEMNEEKETIIGLTISILSSGVYCIAESACFFLVEVINKISASQIRTLIHGQIIGGFLNILDNCTQNDVIFRMLSSMHRLFRVFVHDNGIESIIEDYEASNGQEILESLLDNDDEDICEKAHELLSEIYGLSDDE